MLPHMHLLYFKHHFVEYDVQISGLTTPEFMCASLSKLWSSLKFILKVEIWILFFIAAVFT